MSFRLLSARARLGAGLAGSVVLTVACGQTRESAHAAECYRFDQAYFQWMWKPGRELVFDSSALIELRQSPIQRRWSLSPGERVPLQVRVPGMSADSPLAAVLLRSSYWRPVSTDSIEIWWYDGMSGPTFRLARRRDSLVGMMDFKTDYVGSAPPPHRATAVRVHC